ncbi:MAG: hypothetical protein HY731_12170, partial [Candidatus Tectomicrobia bacterium]|nr:hypothetical protein [Candidatus Tectomicrobia bacterium]
MIDKTLEEKRLLDQYHSMIPPEIISDHFARMPDDYFQKYTPDEIVSHLTMVSQLHEGNLVEIAVEQKGERLWTVTFVAFDFLGEFSAISGLLAASGWSILSGDVYTYIESKSTGSRDLPSLNRSLAINVRGRFVPRETRPRSFSLLRKKIVDIFHLRRVLPTLPTDEEWVALDLQLEEVLRLLDQRKYQEAREMVNAQVINYMSRTNPSFPEQLYPIEIEIDNMRSPSYTIMTIHAEDTPAFLYTFSNALSMRGIYINRIEIETIGSRVRDRLFITDYHGGKLTSEARLRELKTSVVLIKHFTHLITRASNPEMALNHFDRLIDRVSGYGELLTFLSDERVMGVLAQLFGTSNFLWEELIRLHHENLLPILKQIDAPNVRKAKETMKAELLESLREAEGFEEKKKRLNAYKDKEMFRIDMRQILGKISEFSEFSEELSDLAEVTIEVASRICEEELTRLYGLPLTKDGTHSPFATCAIGKLGGREIGYASDIELLFIYGEQGRTSGPTSILTSEYYERLVAKIVETISAKRDGIFEIDLRLRPYGNKGPLASSLQGFQEYYSHGGKAFPFERQALIKLRVIGGDEAFSQKVDEAKARFVFSQEPLNLKESLKIRARQRAELVPPGKVNVKYSAGGLIDTEYYVQYLQIIHGWHHVALHSPNTLEAMEQLFLAGHIPEGNYRTLR